MNQLYKDVAVTLAAIAILIVIVSFEPSPDPCQPVESEGFNCSSLDGLVGDICHQTSAIVVNMSENGSFVIYDASSRPLHVIGIVPNQTAVLCFINSFSRYPGTEQTVTGAF